MGGCDVACAVRPSPHLSSPLREAAVVSLICEGTRHARRNSLSAGRGRASNAPLTPARWSAAHLHDGKHAQSQAGVVAARRAGGSGAAVAGGDSCGRGAFPARPCAHARPVQGDRCRGAAVGSCVWLLLGAAAMHMRACTRTRTTSAHGRPPPCARTTHRCWVCGAARHSARSRRRSGGCRGSGTPTRARTQTRPRASSRSQQVRLLVCVRVSCWVECCVWHATRHHYITGSPAAFFAPHTHILSCCNSVRRPLRPIQAGALAVRCARRWVRGVGGWVGGRVRACRRTRAFACTRTQRASCACSSWVCSSLQARSSSDC
jgi:hypothetical protein